MTERVQRLRQQSFNAQVTLSTERARLITEFYRENIGRYPAPLMRAKAFEHLCRHKTLWIGADKLVVGEPAQDPLPGG